MMAYRHVFIGGYHNTSYMSNKKKKLFTVTHDDVCSVRIVGMCRKYQTMASPSTDMLTCRLLIFKPAFASTHTIL